MNKFLCIKNTYECNLSCWYCSTYGEGTMSVDKVVELYNTYQPQDTLLIGGEPLTLPTTYYKELLDRGVKFSIQTNLTLYKENWNDIFTHPNFTGISVSGDKFNSVDKFFDKYEQLSEAIGYRTIVLILLTRNFFKSLQKAIDWVKLAKEKDFPLRINYVTPLGRGLKLYTKLLPISDTFKIYTNLLPYWKSIGFHRIEPFNEIIESMLGITNSRCPYIKNCKVNEGIVDVELNQTTYPCPAIGDLKKERKEVIVDLPEKCYVCDYFEYCRGCYFRSWVVEKENDINYCDAAKKFFSTLSSYSEEYKKCQKNI